ncbi:uncharacterized protein LOC123508072 [Portunus trituberculatus]|uniref:uncharacterized protein LOC123508072 n=1 Tax=Portunus trituberculatus TaxID=210409 RepID=UPI001E1D1923|nr:uncharacterized protein LOC123508072 [Portunus trituberculatus]
MYLAAKHGQLGKIKQYLEKDRDKNACDEESCNLLACTNIANCLEVVHFLHCNVTDKLVWGHASHACCQEVVEELLVCPHPCHLNVDIQTSYENKAERWTQQ